MRIIETANLTPESLPNETVRQWVYNGLDCCVTLEVLHKIKPQLDEVTRPMYDLSIALQAPVLEMNMRGIKMNKQRTEDLIREYTASIEFLERRLRKLLYEVFGIIINWRSNDALKELLYRTMRVPAIRKKSPKGMVETVERDALEKIQVAYFYTKPIISHILEMRDIGKKIQQLRTAADSDGRMRTSYNIAGTTTFRFSSSSSEFGTGGNLQNIENKLREPFEADAGMKLGYIDLEQAESRGVGGFIWNVFRDGRYLDACESGDLHTSVCRMAWRNLAWSGNLKQDRDIAEQPYYRQHSYRHLAKVLGHGSNYMGQPYTMAQHSKLEVRLVSEFQTTYFRAFTGIPEWHKWVLEQIQRTGQLTSLTGHRRTFLGRRNTPDIHREAVAFGPQCTVGVLLNKGMLNIWRANVRGFQLLEQTHDSILFQYPEEIEDEIMPQLMKLIVVPIKLEYGRDLIIPCDAKTGWNWADVVYDPVTKKPTRNLLGLEKWRGGDKRTRENTLGLHV